MYIYTFTLGLVEINTLNLGFRDGKYSTKIPGWGGSVIYNTYKHLFIKTNYPPPESDIKLKLPFGFTLKYYIF